MLTNNCIEVSTNNSDQKKRLKGRSNNRGSNKKEEVASTLIVQGLNKTKVEDFIRLFKSKVPPSESKQTTSVDDSEAKLDFSQSRNSHEGDNKLGMKQPSDSQPNESKKNKRESMKNNPNVQSQSKNSESRKFSFLWKMECQSERNKKCNTTFTNILDDMQEEVEKAYSEKKKSLKLRGFEFNFGEMSIMVNDKKKGLIRSEVLDSKLFFVFV